jgi:hypothetical protein
MKNWKVILKYIPNNDPRAVEFSIEHMDEKSVHNVVMQFIDKEKFSIESIKEDLTRDYE